MSEGKLTGQGIPCKVCGDKSSGKHYGVASCDGCRGFFKRSIRRNLEYHCKENGNCIVDVSRRNQCQSCRFAKCLKANMRREAVQHERAPRTCMMNQSHLPINGMQNDLYNTRRLPLSSCGLFLPMPTANLPKFPTIPNFRYLSQFQGRIFDSNQFGNSVYFSQPDNCSKTFTISGQTTENILSLPTIENNSVKVIPPTSNLEYTSSGKEDEVTSTEITSTVIKNQSNPKKEAIFESAAKLLFLAVKWARSVPSFTQLPSRDQTKLLEESWAELFVITSAQWNTIDTSVLPKENGVCILQKAINQFIALRVDHTESACLKALVLFKPETTGITSVHQIASLQEQTLNLLYEKCGGVRLGHVLLILPLIKAAANAQSLQEMFFKGTVGEVAIERLLFDLMNT